MMTRRIPAELEEVPGGYLGPAAHRGRVERIEYETYDAFHYGSRGHRLTKSALVYLPYGYDEAERHDVFYLMHGGGGNERTYLGEHPAFPRQPYHSYHFVDILDHAIENGEIEPLIVVCPTYNNSGDEDSFDFGLAVQLTELFPRELVRDLMPAVEDRYRTFAPSVDEEGFRASRGHRGFGGFSMGSVATWHVFGQRLDCFSNFVVMSGNCGDGSQQAAAVRRSGLPRDGFFVFAATGTADFAYAGFKRQVMNMANRFPECFRLADAQEDGNLSFREKAGATHDYAFANQYLYNGLRFFWGGAA